MPMTATSGPKYTRMIVLYNTTMDRDNGVNGYIIYCIDDQDVHELYKGLIRLICPLIATVVNNKAEELATRP